MTEATFLLRQVHPDFIQAGKVTSQAFRPKESDNGLLSVYDHDLITPDRAFIHYTNTLKFRSVGSMSVSVAECVIEQLPARPDPEPFPEHAVVDFTAFDKKATEKKAKKLKAKAEQRGLARFDA